MRFALIFVAVAALTVVSEAVEEEITVGQGGRMSSFVPNGGGYGAAMNGILLSEDIISQAVASAQRAALQASANLARINQGAGLPVGHYHGQQAGQPLYG